MLKLDYVKVIKIRKIQNIINAKIQMKKGQLVENA